MRNFTFHTLYINWSHGYLGQNRDSELFALWTEEDMIKISLQFSIILFEYVRRTLKDSHFKNRSGSGWLQVKTSLKHLGNTRWEARIDSVKVLRFQIKEITSALHEVIEISLDCSFVSKKKKNCMKQLLYIFLIGILF